MLIITAHVFQPKIEMSTLRAVKAQDRTVSGRAPLPLQPVHEENPRDEDEIATISVDCVRYSVENEQVIF